MLHETSVAQLQLVESELGFAQKSKDQWLTSAAA